MQVSSPRFADQFGYRTFAFPLPTTTTYRSTAIPPAATLSLPYGWTLPGLNARTRERPRTFQQPGCACQFRLIHRASTVATLTQEPWFADSSAIVRWTVDCHAHGALADRGYDADMLDPPV